MKPLSICDGRFREEIDSRYETGRESLVRIKNETETAVRAEMARLWGHGRHGTVTSGLSLLGAGLRWLSGSKAAGTDVCRCPHCLADILALALSKLPAGYCLSHHYAVGRRRVDDDEVTPEATLVGDLGAESIDFLDIVFRLEKAFDISIPRGELFPEDILTNAEYIQDGKLTTAGLAEVQKRMPFADFGEFAKNPVVQDFGNLLTVADMCRFVELKLQSAESS